MLTVVLSACGQDEPPMEFGVMVPVPADVPNARADLDLVNYLGNRENIHPKVLYFGDGWNGYRYWMAYTPYPSGLVAHENPCIAVSNDGIVWVAPEGLENPLVSMPEGGYNSDTHLVYNPGTDMLECWWRPCDESSGKLRDAFVRRLSSDGVSWDEPQMVLEWGPESRCRLSPCVSIVDGQYYAVYSDCVNLHDMWGDPTEDGGIIWHDERVMPVDRTDDRLVFWHQDMIIDDDRNVEMIVNAFTPDNNNNSADLYYIRYNLDEPDVISVPQLILARGTHIDDIDCRSIYRSSIVKVDDEYRIYYSSIDYSWHRHMSLTYGTDLSDLHGMRRAKREGTSDRELIGIRFGYEADPEAEITVSALDGEILGTGIGEVFIENLSGGYYVVEADGKRAIYHLK